VSLVSLRVASDGAGPLSRWWLGKWLVIERGLSPPLRTLRMAMYIRVVFVRRIDANIELHTNAVSRSLIAIHGKLSVWYTYVAA
jgi:hypothetical protein